MYLSILECIKNIYIYIYVFTNIWYIMYILDMIYRNINIYIYIYIYLCVCESKYMYVYTYLYI